MFEQNGMRDQTSMTVCYLHQYKVWNLIDYIYIIDIHLCINLHRFCRHASIVQMRWQMQCFLAKSSCDVRTPPVTYVHAHAMRFYSSIHETLLWQAFSAIFVHVYQLSCICFTQMFLAKEKRTAANGTEIIIYVHCVHANCMVCLRHNCENFVFFFSLFFFLYRKECISEQLIVHAPMFL